MDIKHIVRTVIPFANSSAQETKEAKEAASSRLTTEDTAEREGNGQSASDDQKKRRNLTQEELDEAVQYLASLPGLKDNNLTVRLERNAEGIPSILVMDGTGRVVRRIPESEISTLSANKEKKSGHLLNRAM